jgi:hypothetical protein
MSFWDNLVQGAKTYGTFRADVTYISSLVCGLILLFVASMMFVTSPGDLVDTVGRIDDMTCTETVFKDFGNREYDCNVLASFEDKTGSQYSVPLNMKASKMPGIYDPIEITYSSSDPASTAHVGKIRPRLVAIVLSIVVVILFGSVALNKYFVHESPEWGTLYGTYASINDTFSLMTGKPFSLL